MVAVAVVTLPATALRVAVLAAVGNLELLRWVPQAQMVVAVLVEVKAAVRVEVALPALIQEGLREVRADTYYPDQAVLVERRVVGLAVLADQAITQADRVLTMAQMLAGPLTHQAAVVAGEQVAEPTG